MATTSADMDDEAVDIHAMVSKRREKRMTPIEKMRDAVFKESATIRHLGSVFRLFDENGNQLISINEFKAGLKELNIKVNPSDVQEMFSSLDLDKSGMIDFNEFLHAMKPKAEPKRKTIIEQAFAHLQRNAQGKVTVATIEKTYNTNDDPQLGSLEWKGSQGLESITKAFTGPKGKDTMVTKQEFVDYYAYISTKIPKDEHFERMMTHSWNLKPGSKKKTTVMNAKSF